MPYSNAMLDRLKAWAHALRRDIHALYLAGRDPRVPWTAKAVAAAVAAYALSPIDLIPDFIPILGQLDDLIIVPLGIMLAIRLIPSELWTEHRATAARTTVQPQTNTAALVIVAIWTTLTAVVCWLAYRELSR